VKQNLRAEAQHRGISPERILFTRKDKEYSDYLAKFGVADLFLDTFPFNAGATASDALWAGLPLVTCSGEPYTARMAGSLLKSIGLPELITSSLDEYEALILRLARSPTLLSSLRAKLLQNRQTAALFDTKAVTRHIETAYEAMHQRFQAGLAADHIQVTGS
jgi:predicted O-linked N-acetylglucosamine transferase (SPINDLY family)